MLSTGLLDHPPLPHVESECVSSECVSSEPEPEPELEQSGQEKPLQQYVVVRPCEVTDCCDVESRVIGRLKPGAVLACMARVTDLPVDKGCIRVCFQTPRLSMLEGPNQWVSVRCQSTGCVQLEKLPHEPTAQKAPPLPWEGCGAAENQDQLRAMLCELTAEEARRRVALLMTELCAMDNLKRELQVLKISTREQQRQLAAATAEQTAGNRSIDVPTVH
jgi:hypothetical protein|eukprot:COSAG02_NODE_3528_length_6612_cov_9.525411_8_plen_219_part_00